MTLTAPEVPSRTSSSQHCVGPRRVSVAITGATWPLGKRVVERLVAVDAESTTYDVTALPSSSKSLRQLSNESPFDVLVHLAPGDHDALAARGRSAVVGTPEVLAIAEICSARHVVLQSSALVYGAWPNNPVPLTEEAALRPDFGFAFARQLATVEQLVDEWRSKDSVRTATILRPVPAMAADGTSSLIRALAAGMGGRFGEDDVPAQFVHLDDLADAVVLAIEKSLDGVFNVAPDGFIPGARVRSLSGLTPRLRLPDRIAEFVADVQWRFQRGPIPPGLRPYVRSPWLVSNDRLRSEGWKPTVTNEQAFVEGTDDKWWTMLTPKRKQEIALGASTVTLLGIVLSIAMWMRRRH